MTEDPGPRAPEVVPPGRAAGTLAALIERGLTLEMPGGPLATRPLHFIWILDCSGSMAGEKIQSLNFALRESVPAMQQSADENPNASVLVRALRFGDGARWHVATPTPVGSFLWTDVDSSGVTDMGAALGTVAEQLRVPPMTDRALPPVLVLVSDGQPTDDFQAGLAKLMAEPWGRKAVRIAIAIGADADMGVLESFMGNPAMKPLRAESAAALVQYIRWASTAVLKAASAPRIGGAGFNDAPTILRAPVAPVAADVAADDVW